MKHQFDAELLSEVTHAARIVWGEIAADVYAIDETENYDAVTEVECSLDADRLLTFGYRDEYAAFKLLLEQGDFQSLCKAIATNW